MIETKPCRKYRIKLKDGQVIPNVIRTRNTWNKIGTGAFVAYNQDVIDAEGTFYCPEHGPELHWLSDFNDDNEHIIFCDYCGRVLTDTEPDYKAFEQEQVKQLEQQRKERNKKKEFVKKNTHIRNHSRKRIHLEYKKIRDTYEYILEYADDTGFYVKKKEYDSYDLPETIIDERF
jgi:hypothetical protein